MKMPKKTSGFSLIEVICVITISMIVLRVGFHYLQDFLMRQERYLTLSRLKIAIQYAKQTAITHHKAMVLCPTFNHQQCEGHLDWSHGYLLVEKHALKTINTNFPFKTHYGQLHFEGFGEYLILKPDGTTSNPGTFTYCPKDKNPRKAQAMTINRAARTYLNHLKNSIGIPLKMANTPKETPITCR